MNEPQLFNFEGNQVRTILVEDEPYFVATDVANVLGLSNVTVALSRLDDDERSKFNLGRQGETNIINEYGLYNLVLASRKPNAKKFKRWVTHEVLPTIRKHGAYLTPETIEQALTDPDTIIRLATTLKEERTKRLVAEQQVQELKPKADYYDKILRNKGLVTISTIAKNYGMSATAFNKLLHKLGVQFNQGGTWLLYSKYQDKGYTHTEPFDYLDSNGRSQVKTRTKWTMKGHVFIYELLKKHDYLPLIEQEEIA